MSCIFDVILCMIYRKSFDTDIGRKCAYIALDLTGIILLFLLLPCQQALFSTLSHSTKMMNRRRNADFGNFGLFSPPFFMLYFGL